MLELYEISKIPIMCYGCEIWGFEEDKDIEKVELWILKYWDRLCSEDIPFLLKDAANLSIHNATNSSNNWVGNILSVYNQTGFTSEFDGCEPVLRNQLMRDQFLQRWNEYLQRERSERGLGGNKLWTYRKLKHIFKWNLTFQISINLSTAQPWQANIL